MKFSSVINFDDLTEKEWIELPLLDGITKVNKKDTAFYESKINDGWTCLTPQLYHSQTDNISVNSLWIKPEDWNKVINAFKKHINQLNKEQATNEWIEEAKRQHIIEGVSFKDNKKDMVTVIAKKEWLESLSENFVVLSSLFYIPVPKKTFENWVFSYHNTKQFYSNDIHNELQVNEKFSALASFLHTNIFPVWSEKVSLLNNAQKAPWLSWLTQMVSKVYFSGDEHKKITAAFTGFIEKESSRIKRQEKEAAMIAAEKLVNFDKFEQHFKIARSEKRVWTFFMGPPNTGKTYRSFQILTAADSGYYLAPLRLLALEGHETLLEKGVLNDLITGEERRRSLGSTFVSSTVEMARWNKRVGASVLDEVQLLADPGRGWAWTQAVLSAPTNQLVLTGSQAALPYVERMVKYLGDELNVVKLTAEKELRRDKALMSWKRVQQGDAIIAFSRKDVLAWKEEAEQRGLKVSVIYGHLSPEVRREEARKFRDGETDYLIATDAIGLGLNLPIKRIVLSTLVKFDGDVERLLKPSEVWQIANRAGRKGWVVEGGVTTWSDNDEAMLWQLLDSKDEPPRDLKWWVQPLPDQIALWHEKLGGTLPQWLSFFANHLLKNHPVFKACPMTDAIERSYKLVNLDNLSITEQYSYATAPVDSNDIDDEEILLNWAIRHSQGQIIDWEIVKEAMLEKESYHSKDEALLDAEKKVKLLTVYRWLTQRFPDVYTGNEDALIQHAKLNARIEEMLHAAVRKKELEGKSISKKQRNYFK